jgi:hypothetical protein
MAQPSAKRGGLRRAFGPELFENCIGKQSKAKGNKAKLNK